MYLDGQIIALIANDVLYFKTDDHTRPDLKAEGSQPFTYTTRSGIHALQSYWRAPERVFDDPEAFLDFARSARAAARRLASTTPRPRK